MARLSTIVTGGAVLLVVAAAAAVSNDCDGITLIGAPPGVSLARVQPGVFNSTERVSFGGDSGYVEGPFPVGLGICNPIPPYTPGFEACPYHTHLTTTCAALRSYTKVPAKWYWSGTAAAARFSNELNPDQYYNNAAVTVECDPAGTMALELAKMPLFDHGIGLTIYTFKTKAICSVDPPEPTPRPTVPMEIVEAPSNVSLVNIPETTIPQIPFVNQYSGTTSYETFTFNLSLPANPPVDACTTGANGYRPRSYITLWQPTATCGSALSFGYDDAAWKWSPTNGTAKGVLKNGQFDPMTGNVGETIDITLTCGTTDELALVSAAKIPYGRTFVLSTRHVCT